MAFSLGGRIGQYYLSFSLFTLQLVRSSHRRQQSVPASILSLCTVVSLSSLVSCCMIHRKWWRKQKWHHIMLIHPLIRLMRKYNLVVTHDWLRYAIDDGLLGLYAAIQFSCSHIYRPMHHIYIYISKPCITQYQSLTTFDSFPDRY